MAAKPLLKAIGAEIRERRVGRNLSQEQLAERAGLHRNFIGFIERGQRNPTFLTLIKIADAMRVSAAELVSAALRRARPPTG